MNESEFLNSIDCRFPYQDEPRWRALILQGKTISANASFGVLHEIARKPFGHGVSEREQLAMLGVWRAENDHPLVQLVVEAAQAIITGNLLPVDRVLELLDRVRAYPDQYCALGIISFACDDVHGIADEKRQAIVNFWESSSEEINIE
jgi:hypothetical protein